MKFKPQIFTQRKSFASLVCACAVSGMVAPRLSAQAQTTVTFKATLASAVCTPSIAGGETVDLGTLKMSDFPD